MRLMPAILLISSIIPITGLSQVYSWRDASGKVHYGDRPPAAARAESRKLAAPPPADAEAAGKERPATDPEKLKQAQEEGRRQQEKETPAEARKREAGCQQAKANLAAIESGQIRFTIGADGERKALDGAVRDAEIAKARAAVGEWCAPARPAAK
jgi:hypothetical protein